MGRFVTLVVLLLLGCLGLLVYVQLDAPVVRVSVSGQLDEAERREIRQAVQQTIDGGLLSADLEALKGGIMALSWPRAVTIRRAWPETLQIDVEKPMVVARWQDAYLASDGSVVKLPGARLDLPRFDCEIAEPRLAMEVFHRLSAAGATERLTIVGLRENELGEWALTLRDKDAKDEAHELSLMLGAESVAERLDRFLVVYRHHLAVRLEEIAGVDARYDNGVAVRWQQPEAGAALLAAAEATRKTNQL